jgi:hypothetical protein
LSLGDFVAEPTRYPRGVDRLVLSLAVILETSKIVSSAILSLAVKLAVLTFVQSGSGFIAIAAELKLQRTDSAQVLPLVDGEA